MLIHFAVRREILNGYHIEARLPGGSTAILEQKVIVFTNEGNKRGTPEGKNVSLQKARAMVVDYENKCQKKDGE